jgi:hypothetical protein
MRTPHRPARAALAACAALAALPATAGAAEQLYGVTEDTRVVTFTSDAPGNIERSRAITGLQSGERVLGIDVRPNTDQLYALGSTSRIYTVNPTTGAARAVGAGPFTPALNGTTFGFDVNPQADALRVTSDNEQNLRISFATGAVAGVDTPLAYAAGDPGAGSNPSVGAVAYTNSVPGATSTTLLGIDSARDVLVRQNPPNAGVLATVGPHGADVGEPAGFDIGTGDIGFAALRVADAEVVALYRIDLTTGRAAPVSDTPAIGTQRLVDLAAAGTVPDDDQAPAVSVAASSTQLEQRLLNGGLRFTVACDEACEVDAEVRVAGRRAGTAEGAVLNRAGRDNITLELNQAARNRIRRPGTVLLSLTVEVRDTAGNERTIRRSIRTRG